MEALDFDKIADTSTAAAGQIQHHISKKSLAKAITFHGECLASLQKQIQLSNNSIEALDSRVSALESTTKQHAKQLKYLKVVDSMLDRLSSLEDWQTSMDKEQVNFRARMKDHDLRMNATTTWIEDVNSGRGEIPTSSITHASHDGTSVNFKEWAVTQETKLTDAVARVDGFEAIMNVATTMRKTVEKLEKELKSIAPQLQFVNKVLGKIPRTTI